ncbi:fused MFS/spermidine synthase [Streptomyces sp. B6B3]|uniref:spermidine synthase n=1 Tax=Streptomyces sp. B6B3 TaxID=3153570 RepID=UPI00325F9111
MTRRTDRQDDAAEPRPVRRAVDGGVARLLPDVDRDRAWLLTVDDAPQSYVDLTDPTHLEFPYLRRIADVLDTHAPTGRPLDVLHLGGGALTLPRYVAATRPGSRQRVVEVDGPLAELVARHLPPPAGAGIGVEVADALGALAAAPAGSADVVVADVYVGSRIPAHLGTLDHARACARVLRPGGVHVANLADAAPFGFLRSQLAAFATVLDRLCLVAEPDVLAGRRFGNVVLVAGGAPLPVAELTRRAARSGAELLHGAALAPFVAGAAAAAEPAAVPAPRAPRGAFRVG